MTKSNERKTVYCHTSEDWYPNYPDNKVKVSMHINKDRKQQVVCIWGADDCGMELWSEDKTIIRKLFRKISKMKDVTKEKLRNLGLYRA
jgi:hypothetical protein